MLYGPNERDLWEKIYSSAFIDELEGYLKEAAAAVAPGSLEARRVAWIREELFERVSTRAKAYRDANPVNVERAQGAE